jgi:hypothetical protein
VQFWFLIFFVALSFLLLWVGCFLCVLSFWPYGFFCTVITLGDFPSPHQTLLVFRWCGNNNFAVQKKKIWIVSFIILL